MKEIQRISITDTVVNELKEMIFVWAVHAGAEAAYGK